MAQNSGTHTVMPKKLAQALMEAGMHHFDLGGPVSVGNGSATAAPIGGFVGQLLGGNNFQASGANIQNGTNNQQLNTAYNGVQQGLTGQQGLTTQLNTQVPSAIQNQQALAQQILNESNGTGPNPAQAALNQATGNNVAQQAALMASQRGASVNPMLVARNAALTGANVQQQAAGQSATLQAQQQLAAQQALENLSNNQVQQAQTANQQNIQGNEGEQSTLQNANTAANNANVGIQSNVNNVNAQTSANNANQGKNIGSLLNGAGGAISSIASLFADGGEIGAKNMKNGGKIPGKAEFAGNDKRNDVVPILASKGEVMLPNTVTQAKDAPEKAAEFVRALQAKKSKEGESGYGKVAASKKSLKDRVTALEKMCAGGMA